MSSHARTASIVLAAGSSTRFGHSINKVWLQLDGKHIISRSLTNASAGFVDARVILVINRDDEEFARAALVQDSMPEDIEIVYGGASRHESEYKALQYLKSDIKAGAVDLIVIHDGARPLATPALFVAVAQGAAKHGGAIPAITLDSREMDTAHSESVARVQTPQGFRADDLLEAYEKAATEGFVGTDTAACMERFSPELKVQAVAGEIFNIKITYPQDLDIAHALLKPL